MAQAYATPAAPTVPAQPQSVLVVDDSRLQRRILSAYLTGWGYHVIEADSAEAALRICADQAVDLIVSDWIMPGMDGLQLCQAFRQQRADRYGYFILLTSISEKDEVARGLDVGADDFLTKPVDAAELRARIRAGQRVLDMERQLIEKNRLISDTLDKMDRDLVEAQKLQQSLVRDRFRQYDGLDVSLLLRSAGHVGGDLVGAFAVSDTEIGIYSFDVAGHGIASALMTARLATFFSGNAAGQNIAIETGQDGRPGMRSPAEVAAQLNRLLLEEQDSTPYLTLLLARVQLDRGIVTMTQAGHPHPALQHGDGRVEFIGPGGYPVGLIPGATFEDFEVSLNAGDRLFLGSDGITECENEAGAMLEEDGLAALMTRNAANAGPAFFDALLWDLTAFAGRRDFADDVSGVLLEFL